MGFMPGEILRMDRNFPTKHHTTNTSRMNRNYNNNNKLIRKRKNKNPNTTTGLVIARLSHALTQPARLFITLRYNIHNQINNSGQPVASKAYYTNGAYDVDPSVGSTAMPGFAEWSALFGSYRVRSAHVDVDVATQEAFPVGVTDLWLPDSTYASTNSAPPTISTNRNSQLFTLSSVGGMDRKKINRRILNSTLFGDKTTYEGDLNQFVGTALTNPITLFTWLIIITPVNPADTLINGVSMWGYIEFEIEFFNPLILRM